jgi:hypothetical protein
MKGKLDSVHFLFHKKNLSADGVVFFLHSNDPQVLKEIKSYLKS